MKSMNHSKKEPKAVCNSSQPQVNLKTKLHNLFFSAAMIHMTDLVELEHHRCMGDPMIHKSCRIAVKFVTKQPITFGIYSDHSQIILTTQQLPHSNSNGLHAQSCVSYFVVCNLALIK